MNDLGVWMAWSAVRTSVFLVPATALYLVAARRGPVSGSWVASWSLGFLVALEILAVVPWAVGIGIEPVFRAPSDRAALEVSVTTSSRAHHLERRHSGAMGTGAGTGWTLAPLRSAWRRFETDAASPANGCRRFGSVLAFVVLIGTALGLLRLLLGLWAVHVCRVRSQPVDEPGLTGLLEELRQAIGCRRRVEVRESIDLTTPATAGFWRVVVLLPADWRSWDAGERRAVLAHELAHVAREDYATGLLSRLVLALHFYHPMVYWLAGRLQLDQELAADALGAQFAGGNQRYLHSLSRLVLRQDGPSPTWPARAFLPARGTLIRRIAMLRDDKVSRDRPGSGANRLLTVVTLLSLTLSLAMLRSPARGVDEPAKETKQKPVVATPFMPFLIGDDMTGVVAFRPASAFQRKAIGRLKHFIIDEWGFDPSHLPKEVPVAKGIKVDTTRPGFLKLDLEDIEWVTCGLKFGRNGPKEGPVLHSMMFVAGFTVRTVAAFDWLVFFRQWHQGLTEVREGGQRYYKVDAPVLQALGWRNACVYLPDDRTLVLDEEKAIRALVSREVPASPPYLRGAEWERASHGLLAVAINNQDRAFAKQYDLGRPDDAVVMSLFKDVDHWIFGVDDADAIAMHASAACRNEDATKPILSAVESLLKLGREVNDQDLPDSPSVKAQALYFRMLRTMLANVRVQSQGHSVQLKTAGFGTLTDVATLIQAEIDFEARSVKQVGESDPQRATQ